MKLATATAVTLLSGLATADYYASVLCVVPTVTVTATEKACNTYPGSYVTPPPANPPYITTANGYVTSCDYGSDFRSTIYVYPTGKPSYDASCAVYDHNTIISVNIVNINVVVNNYGQTTTVTSTKTEIPTYTPPPPPGPTYTYPGYNTSTSSYYPTGYSSSSSIVTYSSSKPYTSSSTAPYSSSSTYPIPIYTTSSSYPVPTYSSSSAPYVGSSSSAKTYPTPPIYPRGNRAARRAA